jgi:hypothetical protein
MLRTAASLPRLVAARVHHTPRPWGMQAAVAYVADNAPPSAEPTAGAAP